MTMNEFEKIAQEKIQNVASQYGISASELGNTLITEVESKYGKAVASAFGQGGPSIDMRQGSATYGQVVQMSNGVVTPVTGKPSIATTAAPIPDEGGGGRVNLSALTTTPAPSVSHVVTDPPKSGVMVWFTDSVIGDIPNWTLVAAAVLCSCVCCMFLLVILLVR